VLGRDLMGYGRKDFFNAQDGSLDWSYPHPGAPVKSEPIHRQWFMDRWRQTLDRKKNGKFFDILRQKSIELTASKLITYYGFGVIVLATMRLNIKNITHNQILLIGKKASESINESESWKSFLDSLSSSLSDLLH
jgi:hypothetical protein